MTPPIDRRATLRFQSKPGCKFTYGLATAEIRDVSMDGIFVLDPDPLPAGSELAFTILTSGSEIALEGIVRHVEDQVGMGIQFVNVSIVSQRRLRIYIASLAPATS
ncbi:MAG: PilZ domain-containing protein, partial [Candidatus Acidiferrales bacterium]